MKAYHRYAQWPTKPSFFNRVQARLPELPWLIGNWVAPQYTARFNNNDCGVVVWLFLSLGYLAGFSALTSA